MLGRPATTIKLTPEDVLEYDDSLTTEDQFSIQGRLQEKNFSQEQMAFRRQSLADEHQRESAKKKPTRDERIGVSRTN